LLKMLRRDDELRLSNEVQTKYALQPDCWDWKWQVTDEVQRQVCREFGFDDVAAGLDLLRGSLALFPGDDNVRQAAHYLRHNIHRECPLAVGRLVPDVPLRELSGKIVLLHDVLSKKSRTVVIAGSHT